MGKMKIKRKPRPFENELKTICDGKSKIILHMELYEGKDRMKNKKYMEQYGASTAAVLRISEYWKGTGRKVVADSLFGSFKTAIQLMNINGLYCICLVKTAHKLYPKLILGETI